MMEITKEEAGMLITVLEKLVIPIKDAQKWIVLKNKLAVLAEKKEEK